MLRLHAVILDKKYYTLSEARKKSQEFIKDENKTFYRETGESYRFRNIAKTKFVKSSFVSKKLNDHVTLVFGILNPGEKFK